MCEEGVSLNCADWGLPSKVVDCYCSRGINGLFPWQAACLRLPSVLSGSNLVFSAPTSSGKTLVAEILVLKRFLETRRKALIILPFISVAREKMLFLQSLYGEVGVVVDGYMGTFNPVGGIQNWDVAVCTIEKANALVNRLIEDDSISKIGTVVVDELHTVSDSSRGYLLELLLTKLLFLTSTHATSDQDAFMQVIGMSATICNLDLLAGWLNAQMYSTDYRPVPLTPMMSISTNLYSPQQKFLRQLPAELRFLNDADNVIGLCLETVLLKQGVLIFCQTKAQCEKLAESISRFFCESVRKAEDIGQQLLAVFDGPKQRRFYEDLLRLLGDSPQSPSLLARCTSCGVCYHHAGLTMEERECLEGGFRRGYLRVVVATSTLSSGVNLPAKRVIVRSPWGRPGTAMALRPEMYRQMIGRAGRKGIDTEGESVLVCKETERQRARELMTADLAPVQSTLGQSNDQTASANLKRALLEAIVGGMVCTMDAAVLYLQCTLFAAQNSGNESWSEQVNAIIAECCTFLVDRHFVVRADDDENCVRPTQLGMASVASSVGPDLALVLLDDLKNARRHGLILETELHMVYLVTPTYMCDSWGSNFKWRDFMDIWARLGEDLKLVAGRVGVTERYIYLKANSAATSSKDRQEEIHMRFYTSLALYDLINEVPFAQVARKYGCTRGFLQSLQQSASTFAGMVIAFCDRLGWTNLKTLLSGFAERLAFGIRRDLTELVQIEGLDGARARQFHLAGHTTAAAIARAESSQIITVLRRAVPFQDDLTHERKAWLSGYPDMSEEEAAEIVQTKARALLNANLRNLGVEPTEVQPPNQPTEEDAPTNHQNVSLATKFARRLSASVQGSPADREARLDSPQTASKMNCSLPQDASLLSNDSTFDLFGSQPMLAEDLQQEEDAELNDASMSPLVLNLSPGVDSPDHRIQAAAEGASLTESLMMRVFGDDHDDSLGEMRQTSLPRRSLDTSKVSEPTTPLMFDESYCSSARLEALESNADASPFSSPPSNPVPEKRPRRMSLSPGCSEFDLQNVCASATDFSKFQQLVSGAMKTFACAFSFERRGDKRLVTPSDGILVDGRTKLLTGVALCSTTRTVHYIDFKPVASSDNDMVRQSCETADKMKIVENLFIGAREIVCLDLKQTCRLAKQIGCCLPDCSLFCLKTALWMLDTNWNTLLSTKDMETERKFVDDLFIEAPDKMVACRLAWLCVRLRERATDLLRERHLFPAFHTLIMPSHVALARMEWLGICFSLEKAKQLQLQIEQCKLKKAKLAEQLAGRSFSLNSPGDIAQVLFSELNLAAPACAGGRRHISTSKEVLEKLADAHPLPSVILDWRRLQNALRSLRPLISGADGRGLLHGRFDPFSATGRVVMHEPNLQNIPKSFLIDNDSEVSMRSLFSAGDDWCILSADYSQLELRVLAHFSRDERLLSILNSDLGDVFKLIAGCWKGVEEWQVTDAERQQAKQVCYGIIYGMGTAALANNLSVNEKEAEDFIETFMQQFSGVRVWRHQTVTNCRRDGFVSTLSGRRRSLPLINTRHSAERAASERQAVNTVIQGSAADLFLAAMVKMDWEISHYLSDCCRLVMELHDELILEVKRTAVDRVSEVVRRNMEQCWVERHPLSVRLRVKVQTGPSWGRVSPLN